MMDGPLIKPVCVIFCYKPLQTINDKGESGNIGKQNCGDPFFLFSE